MSDSPEAHSEAIRAKIDYQVESQQMALEISDNGKGMIIHRDFLEHIQKGRFGLA